MFTASAGEVLANQPWWFQVIGVVLLIWFLFKLGEGHDKKKDQDEEKK